MKVQVHFENYLKENIRKWSLRSGISYTIYNSWPLHIIEYQLDDDDLYNFLRIMYYHRKKNVKIYKLKEVEPLRILKQFFIRIRPFRAYKLQKMDKYGGVTYHPIEPVSSPLIDDEKSVSSGHSDDHKDILKSLKAGDILPYRREEL